MFIGVRQGRWPLQIDYRPCDMRRISSWDPINCASKLSGLSRITSRNRKPAPHSKTCGASFLIPIPAWTWGRPKARTNSCRASSASARSLLCSTASWSMSAGVITKGFFKFLDGWFFDDDAASVAEFLQASGTEAINRPLHLLGTHAVFLPNVFVVHRHRLIPRFRLNFDGLKGHDSRSRNNSDLLTAHRGSEPLPQVFLRFGDGERLHIAHIAAFCGLNQAPVFL